MAISKYNLFGMVEMIGGKVKEEEKNVYDEREGSFLTLYIQ